MRKYERGQSLFEVVVAIAISALIIVTIVSLTSSSIQNSSYSKDKTLASTYVQEATEWLRGQRNNDIASFLTHTETPLWCLNDLSTAWSHVGACGSGEYISGTPFTRQVVFGRSLVGAKNLIEADVTVSWTDSKGIHEVTSATNFSDLRQR
jgi:hypothetical protein